MLIAEVVLTALAGGPSESTYDARSEGKSHHTTTLFKEQLWKVWTSGRSREFFEWSTIFGPLTGDQQPDGTPWADRKYFRTAPYARPHGYMAVPERWSR